MAVYLAIAYRWGWLNAHHYVVRGSTDRDQVDQAAREECEDRGGKYGVAVLELTPDESPARRIAYYPSMHGEQEPKENPRLRIFQRLGQKVFFAIEDGTAALPSLEDKSRLIPQRVEVPQWIHDEKQRIEEEESD